MSNMPSSGTRVAGFLCGLRDRQPGSDIGAPSVTGWRTYLRAVGPGLIAGASDVDPTTVATIAVIGAGTVYGMGWMVLLLFPLIAVLQTIGTRVGIATRLDLQAASAQLYGKTLRWLLLGSILAVNIVTIAADLEAGAAAVGLLTGIGWRWFVAPLSLVLLGAVFLLGYHVLQRVLKYLLLVLFAYAVSAVMARPHWSAVAGGSLVPHLHWTSVFLFNTLSLIGTTATSYVYVWQTISQAEEKIPWRWYRFRRLDAILGSLFAVVVCWFILVATGATLGVKGLDVTTAQDAAQALRPAAGPWAGDLFALGLLASALVALPVIMSTTAYVTGAHLNWRRGLSLRPRQAPRFFGALAVSVLVGSTVSIADVSPIQLLYWSGVAGALGTPVGLAMLLKVASDPHVMAGHQIGPWTRATGWTITALITVVSTLGLYQLLATGP